jgi:hypothetical protein
VDSVAEAKVGVLVHGVYDRTLWGENDGSGASKLEVLLSVITQAPDINMFVMPGKDPYIITKKATIGSPVK